MGGENLLGHVQMSLSTQYVMIVICVPGPPVFQRVALKNWVYRAWGQGCKVSTYSALWCVAIVPYSVSV